MPFPRRIWLVLALAFNIFLTSDVDPDQYVFEPLGSGSIIICTDPDLSIIKQKSKKNLDSYYFDLLLYDCLSLKNGKRFKKSVIRIRGSGSLGTKLSRIHNTAFNDESR
jgi:hypothetical protein